ncbi:hypothetical protein [Lacinutrix salivirga]
MNNTILNILFVFLIFNFTSCSKTSKLITQTGISNINLGDKVNTRNVSDIEVITDENNVIKSISTDSEKYKTSEGVCVGFKIDSVKLIYKNSFLQKITNNNQNENGKLVIHKNIFFLDSDNDGLIDNISVKKLYINKN